MSFRESVKARRTKEQKLRKHKQLLVESVRQHVLSAIAQQGFAVAPQPTDSGPVDRKWVDTFPFGLLRRPRADGGFDLLEIQFMTYQRAAFRINASAIPKEGIMTPFGPRKADQLFAGGLHDHFEMYANPRWRIWFSLWFWRLRRPLQSDYDQLALKVAGFLPELELALRENKLGPHMRKTVFPTKLRGGSIAKGGV